MCYTLLAANRFIFYHVFVVFSLFLSFGTKSSVCLFRLFHYNKLVCFPILLIYFYSLKFHHEKSPHQMHLSLSPVDFNNFQLYLKLKSVFPPHFMMNNTNSTFYANSFKKPKISLFLSAQLDCQIMGVDFSIYLVLKINPPLCASFIFLLIFFFCPYFCADTYFSYFHKLLYVLKHVKYSLSLL